MTVEQRRKPTVQVFTEHRLQQESLKVTSEGSVGEFYPCGLGGGYKDVSQFWQSYCNLNQVTIRVRKLKDDFVKTPTRLRL